MTRLLSVLALALALTCASAQPSHAGFLVPLILPLVGGSMFLAQVVVAGIGLGLTWAASKIWAPKQPDPLGAQLDLQIDATVSQSIIVGRAVTAGSLVHAEAYGKRGKIDNSDCIRIIAISDGPSTAVVKSYCEEQEVETQEQTGGDPGKAYSRDAGYRGQIVDGYDGKLAVKFYLGDQTAADALAVAALGSHPERPWGADKIGRHRTYMREHAIYDQEKLRSLPRWRFVVDGMAVYDPRQDSSVGGDGPQRFDDLSTHAFSTNLMVTCYNILRGLRVADADGVPQHFWGLENTPAANLPLSNWIAAMNEADVDVDGEPQFHGGLEIPVNAQPLDVVRQIIRACDGRFSELGGIYKVHVGAPPLPVMTIDDGLLRADEGDRIRPVLPLLERVNYVTATYISPDDGWIPKVAPPRGDATYEAIDGRRLEADLDLQLVQRAAHIQRLQVQMLRRSRRERRHTIPLPAACFGLESGDVIAWTSSQEQYDAKLFEVDKVSVAPSLNSTVDLIELDPDDFGIEPGDIIEQPAASLIVDRPAPKAIAGFTVTALKETSPLGVEVPVLRLAWDDPEDGDVAAVRWQLRRTDAPADIISGSTDDVAALRVLLQLGLQSLTDYDVRARFESANGYAADWSLWKTVTTPKCDEAKLAVFAAELHDLVVSASRAGDAARDEVLQRVAAAAAAQDAQNWLDKVQNRRLLQVARDDAAASIEQVETVALGIGASLAELDTNLSARIGAAEDDIAANTAQIGITALALATLESTFSGYKVTTDAAIGNLVAATGDNASSIADLEGAFAAREIVVDAAIGDVEASVTQTANAVAALDGSVAALWTLDVNGAGRVGGMKLGAAGGGTFLDIEVDALRVGLSGSATFRPLLVFDAIESRMVLDGDFYATGAVKAYHLDVATLDAITGDFGEIVAGIARSANSKMIIDLDNVRIEFHD